MSQTLCVSLSTYSLIVSLMSISQACPCFLFTVIVLAKPLAHQLVLCVWCLGCSSCILSRAVLSEALMQSPCSTVSSLQQSQRLNCSHLGLLLPLPTSSLSSQHGKQRGLTLCTFSHGLLHPSVPSSCLRLGTFPCAPCHSISLRNASSSCRDLKRGGCWEVRCPSEGHCSVGGDS